MVGLSQKTLKQCSKTSDDLQNLINVQPEVLLTMYSTAEIARKYIPYIFPEGVSLHFNNCPPKPT